MMEGRSAKLVRLATTQNNTANSCQDADELPNNEKVLENNMEQPVRVENRTSCTIYNAFKDNANLDCCNQSFNRDPTNLKTYHLMKNTTEIECDRMKEAEVNEQKQTEKKNTEFVLQASSSTQKITDHFVINNNDSEEGGDSEDPYATDDGGSDYNPTDDLLDSEDEGDDCNEELQAAEDVRDEEITQEAGTSKKSLTRKKKLDVASWRRNVIKNSRNAGHPYKSWKGKDIAARKMKPACGEKCRLSCSSKISEESRLNIFKEYWGLQDVTRQRDFIFRNVDFNEKATERRRLKTQEETVAQGVSRRKMTFVYNLPSSQGLGKIKVCQTFFLNTLAISHQVVKTVAKKLQKNINYCTIEPDMRGKVQCNSRLPDEVKQSVRDHINLFQPIESHYCRKESSKTYLPSSLNIKRMYELYKTHCSQNNLSVATESIYRQIFCQEFNISFFIPKKDQCGVCTKYKHCNEAEKLDMQAGYDLHMENKNLARETKSTDKEKSKLDNKFCAAVFDLQQVLPCPKIEVGEAYYKRKLSTYNFTVYDLGKKECFCYMWYEVIASRGACEIGSCLLMFINNKIKDGVTEFSFFSDNCSGQNHNRFIYCLFVYLAKKYNVKIRHNFLETGHTQNEGDSAHSVIENASKNIPVYTPSQWCTLVRTASRKHPYKVREISQEDVFDLKDLLESNTINWDKDEDNQKVQWQRIKVVCVDPQEPNVLHFKYNYSEERFSTINLLQKGRKTKTFSEEYELKVLRSSLIPLTKEKYDNLVFFCDKKSIPNEYHAFFRQLPYSTKRRAEDNDDE